MKNTILFLGQLLECTAGISLSCVPYTADAVADSLRGSTRHFFDRFKQKDHKVLYPHLQANTFCEHLICDAVTFLLYGNKDANIVYIWGPVLTKPFSREDMLSALQKQGVSGQDAEAVLHVNVLEVLHMESVPILMN